MDSDGMKPQPPVAGPLDRVTPRRRTHRSGADADPDEADYEFSGAEETAFADLSRSMRRVGVIFAVLAALGGAGTALALWHSADAASLALPALGVLVYGAFGTFTLRAARAFDRILDSEGSDLLHLRGAVVALRKLFDVQFWLFVIGAIGVGAVILSVARKMAELLPG